MAKPRPNNQTALSINNFSFVLMRLVIPIPLKGFKGPPDPGNLVMGPPNLVTSHEPTLLVVWKLFLLDVVIENDS